MTEPEIKEMRLSDLVEREHAQEIAIKNMPESFKWEVNGKSNDTHVMNWIINAMIEYASKY